MEPTRVGVVGVGSMGKHHARIYSRMKDVELVGVADKDSAAAGHIARQYGAVAYDDPSALLDQGLDAVSIAVPTTMHREVACAALERGVNVLLEKPIADSLDSAKEIIRKAGGKGLKLMIGHIERFNPIIPVIKKSIRDEEVIMINVTRVGPLPPRVKDVGVIVDIGVHDIDIIRHLTGSSFKKIYPLHSRSIAEKEDTAIISFEMANGTLAHITTDWLTPYKLREINVSTKKKFIKGDFINQKVTEYSRYKEDGSYLVRNLAVPYDEPLRLELSSFIDCVRNGTEPEVTAHDGMEALKVALHCLSAQPPKEY